MAGFKAQRMSDDIKRIVFSKMRELKDPRIGGGETLTITRCEVSRDGSYCKIYVSSYEGTEKAEMAVKGLTSASGIIKREISNVLKLRKCPDIKFIPDNSGETSAVIYEKLKSIRKQTDEKEINETQNDILQDEQ